MRASLIAVTALILVALYLQGTSAENATKQCSDATLACMGSTSSFCTQMLAASGQQPGQLGKFQKCLDLDGASYFHITADGSRTGSACVSFVGECNMGVCLPDVCEDKGAAAVTKFGLTEMQKKIVGAGLPDVLKTIVDSDLTAVEVGPTPEKLTFGATATIVYLSILALCCLAGSAVTFFRSISESKPEAKSMDPKSEPLLPKPAVAAEPVVLDDSDIVVANAAPQWWKTPVLAFFENTFSVTFSLKSLVAECPKSTIRSLNGIRAISMFWIVIGHTGDFMPSTIGLSAASVPLVTDLFDTFWFQILIGAPYAVDTFFFIGGFLVALLTLKRLRKTGSLNFPLALVHRLWRIIPAYGTVILVQCTLSVYFGSGPMWYQYEEYVNSRNQYWWSNLLFINNFYPTSFMDATMGWTWYMSLDMQYYIIAVPLTMLYHKFPRIGVTVLLSGIAACLITRYALMVHFDYDYYNYAGMGDTQVASNRADMHDTMYNKPYSRIAPYFVGMLVAMLHERLNHKDMTVLAAKLRDTAAAALTFVFGVATVGFLIFYPLTAHLVRKKVIWSTLFGRLWITFGSFAWSMGLALVLWTCLADKGWWLNSFLSSRVWDAPSRLAYLVYLIHPIVIRATFWELDTSIHFQVPLLIGYAFQFYLLTHVYAVALYCLTEKPAANFDLEKNVRKLLALCCMGKK